MEKRFYWLYVTVFINILGFGLVFPILPLFAQKLSATSTQVGLLIATVAVTQFLLAPLIGKMSDRFGRKPILFYSTLITALSLFTVATADSLLQVFIGMAMQGVGNAGVLPVSIAYVADITTGHARSRFISRVTGTFALGFMVGPAIGGFLGDTSLALPFFTAGTVAVINALILGVFLKETHHDRDKTLAIKEGVINVIPLYKALKGDLGVIFVLLFAWAFYIENFTLSVPFFTKDTFNFGPHDNGIFFSSVGFMAGITQWFLLPIVEKFVGDTKTIFLGALFLLAGQFFVPLSGSVFMFYFFFVISVFGSALLRPSLSSYISKHTKEGQGAMMGLAFSFESLGRVISPLLLGVTITQFGSSTPFWITSAVVICAFLLFWKTELPRLKF